MPILISSFSAQTRARLTYLDIDVPCSIGKGGTTRFKKEGDVCTPIGKWPLRRVFYRPDRLAKPATKLLTIPITKRMGWSDDPNDKVNYNRLIEIPYSYSHELLWRVDNIYDIIVELGYNDCPPALGKGSAIFIHIATPDLGPTAGCISVDKNSLLNLLQTVEKRDILHVAAS